MKSRTVVTKAEAEEIVFDYKPKEFPAVISKPAENFVERQHHEASSGFKISEAIAQQAGIAELNRQRMVAKIEEEALQKLKDVEEKAYKEAYDLGKIEGQQKAFEEHQEKLLTQIEKFDDIILNLEQLKTNILQENESVFIKMMYQVASRLAMRKISEDETSILPVLQQLVQDIQADDRVILYLSADDFKFLEELRKKADKRVKDLQNVRFEISESVQSGGCLIETNFGTIDATVEQRVEKLWSYLERRLPKTEGHQESSPENPDNESDDDGSDSES